MLHVRRLAVAVLLLAAQNSWGGPPTRPARPGEPIEYKTLAFNPDRWEKKGIPTRMVPWTGEKLVFLTTTADLDGATLGRFLERLDGGWTLYAQLTGSTPQPFKMLQGKPVIAAIPDSSLTCGYGCGYVGATGIEVGGFYDSDYALVKGHPDAFPHYYFYEMGRNYYTFGDRHSCFITGYAVFMRYVCMDTLQCEDPDAGTRRTIERCEELYARSETPFLKAFTTLDGLDEKAPRLEIQPSDQPCIYAAAMLKLHKDNGGNAWLQRFFAALKKCPEVPPRNRHAALRQSIHWMIASSAAAKKDLSPIFVDRWRLPLGPEGRRMMAQADWGAADLDVKGLCDRVTGAVHLPR